MTSAVEFLARTASEESTRGREGGRRRDIIRKEKKKEIIEETEIDKRKDEPEDTEEENIMRENVERETEIFGNTRPINKEKVSSFLTQCVFSPCLHLSCVVFCVG